MTAWMKLMDKNKKTKEKVFYRPDTEFDQRNDINYIFITTAWGPLHIIQMNNKR